MLAKIFLIVFVLEASKISADAGQDNQVNCQSLIDCLERVSQKVLECKGIINQSSSTVQANSTQQQDCYKSGKEQNLVIKGKQISRFSKIQTCLKSRLAIAKPVNGKQKQKVCQRALSQHRKGSRPKREATNDNDLHLPPAVQEFNRKGRKCGAEADELMDTCNTIGQCCTEKSICELEFAVSPDNVELRKLQLENHLHQKECNN